MVNTESVVNIFIMKNFKLFVYHATLVIKSSADNKQP